MRLARKRLTLAMAYTFWWLFRVARNFQAASLDDDTDVVMRGVSTPGLVHNVVNRENSPYCECTFASFFRISKTSCEIE